MVWNLEVIMNIVDIDPVMTTWDQNDPSKVVDRACIPYSSKGKGHCLVRSVSTLL
jgi:hypothetical protein